MRQRQLPFKQAAERGATVSPSKDAVFNQYLCPADGGAGRPGRAIRIPIDAIFRSDSTIVSAHHHSHKLISYDAYAFTNIINIKY